MNKDRNEISESNRKKIREFLEVAKTSVIRGVALEQEFDGFRIMYDGYWTRYRAPNDFERCQLPEDTLESSTLPECARNCWKLLMFRRKPEDEASVNLLIPLLKSVEIKSFKHNGDRRTLQEELDATDELRPAYARRIHLTKVKETTYVIVIYTWGTEERDKLKEKLHSIGFTNIPYRRGCKMFESRFGPWRQWFQETE
jgi:hypothetical protein